MKAFQNGYLNLVAYHHARLRIHWSSPFGLFLFSGLSFAPGRWVGLAIVIIAHEVGHAYLVHRRGGRVITLDLLPTGGECTWVGANRDGDIQVIAWGGVVAQLLIGLSIFALTKVMGHPQDRFSDDLAFALLGSNLALLLLNLLPLRPLDGYYAWRLVPTLFREWRAPGGSKPRRSDGVTAAEHRLSEIIRRANETEAARKTQLTDGGEH